MTIAIIGCGTVGSAITEQIFRRNFITKIKLIDLNVEKIQKNLKIIKKINRNIKIYCIKKNAMDYEIIKNMLYDVDVAINAASPVCNIPIMNACLESNTNYIDLASDPFKYPDIEGTSLDDQLKLFNSFYSRGLIAVTNTGYSPGFTDLICKYVVKKYHLDSIEYIKIHSAEKIESNELIVSWSPYMFLLETISPATIYKKNKIMKVEFEKCFKNIQFPSPIGNTKTSILSGHPELRTIPEYINIPIDYIEIGAGYLLNDMNLNDVIVAALRRSVEKTTCFNGDIFTILSNSFSSPDDFIDKFKNGIIRNEFFSSLIEIKGKNDEDTLNYSTTINCNLKEINKSFFTGSIGSYVTSFIPTIISEMIIKNEITETGVIAPAGLSKSMKIIGECKKMGLDFDENEQWSKINTTIMNQIS